LSNWSSWYGAQVSILLCFSKFVYCYCQYTIAYGSRITSDWNPNAFQKNAFEWGLSMIPHSEDAIQVTQHVANFFVRWGFCCAEKLLAYAANFFYEMCWGCNLSLGHCELRFCIFSTGSNKSSTHSHAC